MELLKLLLVDDEAIILKGLQMTYDWERMGFQVIGTASSGEKALALLEDEEPDLVLTDVRMKKISGLDLIRMAKISHPNVKFVVISAYKDFEYAQKACHYGALSYLVKPIEEEELEAVMGQAYELCATERKKRQEYNNWRRILLDDREGFLSQMIGKYVNNVIEEEELIQLFESLSGDIGYESHFTAVCMDLDAIGKVTNLKAYETERSRLFDGMEQRLSEKYKFWDYKNQDGSLTYIVDMADGSGTVQLKIILDNLQKEIQGTIISALSNVYTGLGGMRTAYHQAAKLYQVAREEGAGKLIVEPGAEPAAAAQYPVDVETAVLESIRKNDEGQLKEEFVRLVYSLPSREETGKAYLHRLAVRTEIMLDDSYGMSENVRSGYRNFYQMLEQYTMVRLVDMFYKLLVTALEERRALAPESTEVYFSDYIKVAVDYIKEHLQDENLSITTVSAQIYLNPVYFGRVFKNIVGISFKRYVLNERMERAKQLILSDSVNIAEICGKVGINNPSYFTQLFKQSTGMLPSDYKKEFMQYNAR